MKKYIKRRNADREGLGKFLLFMAVILGIIAALVISAIVLPGPGAVLAVAVAKSLEAKLYAAALVIFTLLTSVAGVYFVSVPDGQEEVASSDEKKADKKELDKEEEIETKREQPEYVEKDKVAQKNNKLNNGQKASSKKLDQPEDLKSGSEKRVMPLKKVNTVKSIRNNIAQKKNKISRPPDFTP